MNPLSKFYSTATPQVKAYYQSLLTPGKDLNTVYPSSPRSEVKPYLTETRPLETLQINDGGYADGQIRKSFEISTNKPPSQAVLESKPMNFSEMAKKIGQFSKNAMANREKDFEEEYLQGLDTAYKLLDCGKSKNRLLRGINNIIFFNIQISIFIFNLMSLMDAVWLTDYRLGIPDFVDPFYLERLEWAVGSFFFAEVILNILGCEGGCLVKIIQILNFKNISNMLLIGEIITTTVYSENFVRVNTFFILVFVLRAFKLIKLRIIIQQMWKKFKKLITTKTENILTDSWNSQSELKYFVYNSAVDIIIAIFIEASAFMAIDEALGYAAFSVYNNAVGNKFTYIAACYYSIVSLTTIGYGDIYPITWESRMFAIVIIFFNISVLSNFLSNFTDKIYQISPFIRNFNFKNHIVIIGELPTTFLRYFIKELHLCDSVINSNLRTQSTLVPQLSKMILVGKDMPSKELQMWLEDFTENYVEIRYLKSNIFDNSWFKQTNLVAARHIFAFSMNLGESQEQARETDKAMVYNMQKVVTSYPNLEITLVLSSDMKDQANDKSLNSNINIISTQILNECFMANSLENQGLNTFLTHLVTLREKVMPTGTDMNRLEEYSLNMSQELYPIRFFFFFVYLGFIFFL